MTTYPALPRIGLGTFRARGTDVQVAVAAALEQGIRHFDTAAIYKNEAEIALALKDHGISREEVFITSKISPYQQGNARATQACEEILQRLNTAYVDLVLIHWPGVARLDATSPLNAQLRRETWKVLESFQREGRFRAIGVSNYNSDHLRQLLEYAEVRPAVNQVEVHPRWQQRELRELCTREGVGVVAYASLGCGELLREEVVVKVAEETGMTAAQVLLVWGLQKGCAVIPKSVHPQYIQQYRPDVLLALRLEGVHMAALDALGEEPRKYCWDSEGIA